MGSALNSGQYVRRKSDGTYGVTGLDPYGICADNEIVVTFSNAGDRDPWLGNGYPVGDWQVIPIEEVPDEVKKRFSHLR